MVEGSRKRIFSNLSINNFPVEEVTTIRRILLNNPKIVVEYSSWPAEGFLFQGIVLV
jgi:hypothetical protein